MANEYQKELKGCKDRTAIEKVLREYADDSHPAYRCHEREDLTQFVMPRKQTDMRADGLAKMIALLASVAHDPIEVYVVVGRLVGLCDKDIAGALGISSACVGKRRTRIAAEDPILAGILEAVWPEHALVKVDMLPNRDVKRQGQHRLGKHPKRKKMAA